MRNCPNCSAENLEGVLFCERCGHALQAVSISTKKLGVDEDDGLAAGGEFLSQDNVILLHIKGIDDPVALQVIDEVVIGREGGGEERTGAFLSLEPYGAGDTGVSRNHAKLSRQHDQLMIRDLGSTNHTQLNGQRLIEQRDYALRDGDEVALGRLVLRIFFK